ncbi:flagellar basal body-associated FliL family protein [Donghicola tyrosinivorans]|uniref:Flagellar protein FliL n=1 Tax=Donghicola tyrosinivorans TaxID=1652492 RepID=A0A2T0WXY8_9RHOB|nr:flagellar basal body-associated FliL family protein [Donghicola tyrosinivorans]PRY91562.1 flagellar FliL protein [Donghicola tyrosinivorans]
MSQVESETQEKKGRIVGPLIGIALSILGGVGGYAVVGMDALGIFSQNTSMHTPAEITGLELEYAYVPLPMMIVPMGSVLDGRQLRFQGQVEAKPENAGKVEAMIPRLVDVFQDYLRALSVEDLDRSAALMHIRSQLLFRARLVVGEEEVSDFLIMEFVLN